MAGWQQAHPMRGLQLRCCRGCIERPRAAVIVVVAIAAVAQSAADGRVGVAHPVPRGLIAPTI